jgi:hypothetical protein
MKFFLLIAAVVVAAQAAPAAEVLLQDSLLVRKNQLFLGHVKKFTFNYREPLCPDQQDKLLR